MKKILIILCCLLMLWGCKEEKPIESDTGLTLDELTSELKLADDEVYAYEDNSFVLGLRFTYNKETTKITSFKYLGLNQYEIKTNGHTFVLDYSGGNVYLAIDGGSRYLYMVKKVETDPIVEPVDPEKPIEEEGLTKEQLFAYLLNNMETWSSSDETLCVQFSTDYGYAQGYWPEGVTTGFGQLQNFEYGGENYYRLTYYWPEVKNSELYPDKAAYSANIIVCFDPEKPTEVGITNIEGKKATYSIDEGTTLVLEQMWELLKGYWVSEDAETTYWFDNETDCCIYISEGGADLNGDVVKEFIPFGHYEYMVVFDTHLYESIPGEGSIDNGEEIIIDITFKPASMKLVISKNNITKTFVKVSDASILED